MLSVPRRTSGQAIFGLSRNRGRVSASAYDQLILGTPDLTHYWPFVHGSGADVVGRLPFTRVGTVRPVRPLLPALGVGMDCAAGLLRTAVNFPWTTPMTMECWFRTPATTTANGGIMGAWGGAVLLMFPTANLLRFYTTSASIVVIGVLATNTIYHAVASHDGTSQRLYLNGVRMSGPSVAAAPTTSDYPFELGTYAGQSFDNGLNAIYSNAATYGRALSDAEVLAHYDAGIA